jgi:Flp pilus assembly protein TadD
MIILMIAAILLALPAESSETLYSKGVELARSGHLKEALHELEQAARLSPSNPKIHNMLGVVLTQLGRLQEADSAYGRALSLVPGFYPARKNRAVSSFTQGDLRFASREFEAMVKIDPKDFVPPLFLGLIAIENNSFGDARSQLQEANRRSPGNFKVLMPLIRVNFILGERATALEQARSLWIGSRIQDNERFELGVLLAQFAANGEAAEVFKELKKRQPDSYDVTFNLALAEYRSGRFAEALIVTSQYAAGAKLTGEMLNLQGWIYGKMRRMDEAARHFRMAMEAEPLNGDHYLDLSNALERSADVEGAIQVVLKGIEHQVDLDRLQIQLGLLYQKNGEVGQAESCFQKALERNPGNRSAYLASALLLYQTNRKTESLNLLKTSTTVLPRDAFLYYLYGGQLLEEAETQDTGKLEEAMSALKKALELNPLYANTNYLLGRLYAGKGDYATAESFFEKACAFNPRHSEALWQLTLIARQQGKKERVAELTQRMQKFQDQSEQSEPNTFLMAVQDSLRSGASPSAKTKQ